MEESVHDDMERVLRLLAVCTDKKNQYLTRILTITENQENIYAWEKSAANRYPVLREMNVEKQRLIQDVFQQDQEFQDNFKRLGSDFEKNSTMYKPQIRSLQEKIAMAMSLDEQIRRQEDKNHLLLTADTDNKGIPQPAAAGPDQRQPQKSLSKHVLDRYKKNAKKNK